MKKLLITVFIAVSGLLYSQDAPTDPKSETMQQWQERIFKEHSEKPIYKRGQRYNDQAGAVIKLKRRVILPDGSVMWKVKRYSLEYGKQTLYYLENQVEKLHPIRKPKIYGYEEEK